jgi:hypothetical protein
MGLKKYQRLFITSYTWQKILQSKKKNTFYFKIFLPIAGRREGKMKG